MGKSFGFLISQMGDAYQTKNDQLKFKIKNRKDFKYTVSDNNKITLLGTMKSCNHSTNFRK